MNEIGVRVVGINSWGGPITWRGKYRYKYTPCGFIKLGHLDKPRLCRECKKDISTRGAGAKYCEKCASPSVKKPWARKPRQATCHRIVGIAVKAGILPALTGDIKCVDCGTEATCYEHRDYLKPLDVEPVCLSCNYLRGAALNNE